MSVVEFFSKLYPNNDKVFGMSVEDIMYVIRFNDLYDEKNSCHATSNVGSNTTKKSFPSYGDNSVIIISDIETTTNNPKISQRWVVGNVSHNHYVTEKKDNVEPKSHEHASLQNS